ncbi:MAG TPA: hypothetical protein VJL60_01930 [Gammaproteobacteria bacterium]|nr:hypothetical protein [Gammaproteobacteria bacterium]
MGMIFYPHDEDLQTGSIKEKLETLLEAAERYKAVILDLAAKNTEGGVAVSVKRAPREMTHAYNWQEIAKVLREIREMPEANKSGRLLKADSLTKLAEIYEVLRAAKMPKLEAVRLALVNEATQLKGAGTSQVA